MPNCSDKLNFFHTDIDDWQRAWLKYYCWHRRDNALLRRRKFRELHSHCPRIRWGHAQKPRNCPSYCLAAIKLQHCSPLSKRSGRTSLTLIVDLYARDGTKMNRMRSSASKPSISDLSNLHDWQTRHTSKKWSMECVGYNYMPLWNLTN